MWLHFIYLLYHNMFYVWCRIIIMSCSGSCSPISVWLNLYESSSNTLLNWIKPFQMVTHTHTHSLLCCCCCVTLSLLLSEHDLHMDTELSTSLVIINFRTSLKTYLLLPTLGYSNPLAGIWCCTSSLTNWWLFREGRDWYRERELCVCVYVCECGWGGEWGTQWSM